MFLSFLILPTLLGCSLLSMDLPTPPSKPTFGKISKTLLTPLPVPGLALVTSTALLLKLRNLVAAPLLLPSMEVFMVSSIIMASLIWASKVINLLGLTNGLLGLSKRLDRAIANDQWRLLFPRSNLLHHPITTSDHAAVLLSKMGESQSILSLSGLKPCGHESPLVMMSSELLGVSRFTTLPLFVLNK